MKLLLSSDALPRATLADLADASRRRSLAGLELTLQRSQGHALDDSICPVRHSRGEACIPPDLESPVSWLRVPDEISLQMLMIWASEAHVAGAGLLLSKPVSELPPAARYALVHGTDPDEARRAVEWAEKHHCGTAWEAGAERKEPSVVDEVLRITMPRLSHVRLLGSGPEAETPTDEPSGTGALLAKLALKGYSGTVALAPLDLERLPDWEKWLARGRGWGCGTAAEKQARAQGKPVFVPLTLEA